MFDKRQFETMTDYLNIFQKVKSSKSKAKSFVWKDDLFKEAFEQHCDRVIQTRDLNIVCPTYEYSLAHFLAAMGLVDESIFLAKYGGLDFNQLNRLQIAPRDLAKKNAQYSFIKTLEKSGCIHKHAKTETVFIKILDHVQKSQTVLIEPLKIQSDPDGILNRVIDEVRLSILQNFHRDNSESLNQIIHLCKDYQNINAQNLRGFGIAHFAALTNDQDLIKKLHALGMEFNIKTKEGQSPIHIAIKNGCNESMKALLQCGAFFAEEKSEDFKHAQNFNLSAYYLLESIHHALRFHKDLISTFQKDQNIRISAADKNYLAHKVVSLKTMDPEGHATILSDLFRELSQNFSEGDAAKKELNPMRINAILENVSFLPVCE